MNSLKKMMLSLVALSAFLSPLPVYAKSCLDLWVSRNKIFNNKGYCFGSNLGKSYFDNSDCQTKRITLSKSERNYIARIKRIERQQGCHLNTSITVSNNDSSTSSRNRGNITSSQHQSAKAQLARIMSEDIKDYDKKYSLDRNGVITVINHDGKRLRGTANNLFVAFNSNNVFMANMVYYGFVWDRKFSIFGNSMIYARQFRSATAAKQWARHIIEETAKLAAMTGHSRDPLAEQKMRYLENEIRNFEAGDSRNRTVRQWYGSVVLPALRQAINGGGSSGSVPSSSGSSSSGGGSQKMHKVRCTVYCSPRHGRVRFKMKARSRRAAERRLKNKGLSRICRSNGYRSVGGGIASDGVECWWN